MPQVPRHKLSSSMIAVAILVATLGIGPRGVNSSDRAEATVTISHGTQAEHEMTLWAVSRFAAAGLDLPNLTVSYHDDIRECDGFIGIYRRLEGHLSICNRGGRPTEPRHTVLHELAHAWSFTTLSSDDINRFNNHRGLEQWQGGESWWQQGAEQLAEIVLWGVQDPADPFRSVWTHTERCDNLAEAFRLVTGNAPLNGNKFCLS